MSTDRIEKSIDLKAAPARVWRALSDHEEFGTWFRVKLDGPFRVGEVSTGHITYPGYEHCRWTAVVTAIEPEQRLAFTWHPYAVEPDYDYASEPQTTVEFTLEPQGSGTRLTVVESGFDALPEARRFTALRMNEGGWTIQMQNISDHVDR